MFRQSCTPSRKCDATKNQYSLHILIRGVQIEGADLSWLASLKNPLPDNSIQSIDNYRKLEEKEGFLQELLFL